MADPKTTEWASTPAAKPRTRVIRVRLNQLLVRDYSQRAAGALEREPLRPLADHIKTEGLRHRPEVYRQDDGIFVVVTGHRRVASLKLLAQDGVSGFADDMEIEVVELLDTTALDRLAWSVADNEVRLNLTPAERVEVVKKFVRAGMPDERGAYALGLSVKQYQRDVTLVRNGWMLALVGKDAIPATTAVELLEAADKKNRPMQLKTFLEDWVAEQELEIEAEGMKRELKPAEKVVRSRLTGELKRHWLDQLAAGKDLDAEVQKKVKVDLNPKTLQVAVQGFKLNLQTDPVEDIARLLSALSQVAKTAAPILRTRVALEGAEGPQAKLLSAKDAPQFDTDFLREAGLENLIGVPRPGLATDPNSGEESKDSAEGT
jgi:ParB-like chromosome segregation protein Spo0J